MKHHWQRVAKKIDALSLRERVIVLAMSTLVLVALLNALLFDAQFEKRKQITQRVAREQTQIAGIQAEIQQQQAKANADPDMENRAKLHQLNQQISQHHAGLRDLQKGLVSPDKISVVLEDILRQNGRLKLVSLRTLPVTGLLESDGAASKGKPVGGGLPNEVQDTSDTVGVYKHGVEIKLSGSYPELLNYLSALEQMRWQLFWGNAKLEVNEYPTSTLTFTLFTLSLDRKWLNL